MSAGHISLFVERTDTEFRRVTLEPLADGLQIFCHDPGKTAEDSFGDAEVEAWTKVPLQHLGKLAYYLLAERYEGRKNAVRELEAFCKKHAIECSSGFWS